MVKIFNDDKFNGKMYSEIIHSTLEEFIFGQMSSDLHLKVNHEIRKNLSSHLQDTELINLIDFEAFLKPSYNHVTVQPNNLFTLILTHSNKIPPVIFLPNRGAGKDSFTWDGFEYSFITNDDDTITPTIKELVNPVLKNIHEVYNQVNEEMMFDLNNKKNREQAKKRFEILLNGVVDEIICDETNNLPDLIDSGEMCVRIIWRNSVKFNYIDLYLGRKINL